MAVTLACVPLMKPLLRAHRRLLHRQPTRVVVARDTLQQRTHRYDPEYAGRLKLRPDMVDHRAEISAARDGAGSGRRDGHGSHGITVPERSYDSSGTDLKGDSRADITVNKQWKVTSEVGEWTQILGGR